MTTKPSDELLRRILRRPATFACVGMSTDPIRPSHYVGRYLSLKGFRVLSINPGHAGKRLFGETVAPDLDAIEEDVDILDVFRRPDMVPPVVAAALRRFPSLRCVWLQMGIVSAEAEAMCAEAGVPIIQDRCPKIEYQRLFGELRMGGFATGLISAKRPS
ncbi:MAG: CoA-binding protein [Pseudomonadota bacterium]